MKIAFIGVGNMASAMIGGITSTNHTKWEDIILFDRYSEKLKPFLDHGAVAATDIQNAVSQAEAVVLSVKPQNFPEILPEIAQLKGMLTEKLFITIAAGITMNSISSQLGNIAIVRALPNTPMLIGKGVSALCSNDQVSSEQFSYAKSLFDANGKTIVITENEMNRIICVTSSSPAYVFLFIRAMYDAAIAQGLPQEGLLDSICDTLIGSAEMLKTLHRTPDELITMVASKGGTTERALNCLQAADFTTIIQNAMQACTDRADELGKQ